MPVPPVALACAELVELVTDHLEGALDDDRRTEVELHLVVCADCEAYVDQMRTTVDLLGALGDGPPGDVDRAALTEALRRRHPWRGQAPQERAS